MIYKQIGIINPAVSLTVLLIDKWDKEHFESARSIIKDKIVQSPADFEGEHSFYVNRDGSSFHLFADHNSFPFEDRLMAASIISDIYNRALRGGPTEGKLKHIGKIINDAYMTVTETIIKESNNGK